MIEEILQQKKMGLTVGPVGIGHRGNYSLNDNTPEDHRPSET